MDGLHSGVSQSLQKLIMPGVSRTVLGVTFKIKGLLLFSRKRDSPNEFPTPPSRLLGGWGAFGGHLFLVFQCSCDGIGGLLNGLEFLPL